MLTFCADHDVRVSPAEALKFLTRLREMAKGGPFLLISREAGHLGCGQLQQNLFDNALRYAWVLGQLLGDEGIEGPDGALGLLPRDRVCHNFVTSRNSETGLFQALANPSRRAILHYLRDKDYVRAGDIAADLSIGRSTLSAHLKVLTQADLLMSRRQRTEIQYRANLSVLEDVIVTLAELRGPRSTADEPPDPPTSSPTERE